MFVITMGGYRAERALGPTDGSTAWVIVDDGYSLHEESCAFLAGLRARGRSSNTERVYAGRVAVYLSWCEASGVDWARPGLLGPWGQNEDKLAGPSVETELVALDVLHHDARLIYAIGTQ